MICIFKCQHCGDKMRFSPEIQALICDTCNTEMPAAEYDDNSITYEGELSFEDGVKKMHCVACGAKVVTDNINMVNFCSYCNAELAVTGNAKGEDCPEGIIPLALSEEDARQKVVSWWLKHETMPELNFEKMKMQFRDIYVPVWLVDVDTVATISADVSHSLASTKDDILSASYAMGRGFNSDRGSHYSDYSKVYKGSTWNNGSSRGPLDGSIDLNLNSILFNPYNASARHREEKTYTTNSVVYKSLESYFEKVPINASSHFSNERFKGIEPFNYRGVKAFRPTYLSGHQAENYSFNKQEILAPASTRAKEYALEQCKIHVEGTVVDGTIDRVISQNVVAHPDNVYYVLVPIWVCSYVYAGKKYYLYVNGQTGKVDGEVIFANNKLTAEVSLYFASMLTLLASLMVLIEMIILPGIVSLLLPIAMAGISALKLKRNLTYAGPGIQSIDILNRDVKLDKVMKNNTKQAAIFRFVASGITVLLFLLGVAMRGGFGNLHGFPTISLIGSLTASVIFALFFWQNRRKQLSKREVVQYNDYLVAASTRVLVSSRLS